MMKRYHVNAVTPVAIADYPAAHSMDTGWFAMDENGEIGLFDTGTDGPVPATLDASPERLESPHTLQLDHHFYHDCLARRDPWDQVPKELRPDEDEQNDEPEQQDEAEPSLIAPAHYHYYNTLDNCHAPYYWVASPARPRNIRDFPASVRERIKVITLKDFTFASREPVNPFDYAPNCYMFGEWGMRLFPLYFSTVFPIPTCWSNWTADDYFDARQAYDGGCAIFFAVDDDGRVAVFRNNGYGAIPQAQWRPPLDRGEDWGFKLWQEMIGAAPEASVFPRPPQVDKDLLGPAALKHAKHWLEYPFGGLPPRLFGLYHYDLSWYHAAPYARIGVPDRPVDINEFKPEWRERMNPARFIGIRFADAEHVQPYEHAPCMPGSLLEDDLGDLPDTIVHLGSLDFNRRRRSEIWIDAALERVHLCTEDSIRLEEDKWLLRRARRYYEKIARLAR